MQVTSPSVPRLRLFAHVDATSGDIAPHESATTDAFEKAWRPDVEVNLQLRHVPSERERVYPSLPLSPAEKNRHLAITAGSLLGMGAVAAAAAMVGRISAVAAAVPAVVGLGIAAVRSASLLNQGHQVDEPDWEGTRTYRIGPDKTNHLDSPVLESKDECRASVADLARFLKPSTGGATAVILAGHGNGHFGCAGFGMHELQLAMQASHPDLVVFESCLMGNLEALDQLHGAARYAVVSEKTQLAGLEHWKPLLETLPAGPLDGEKLGRHILAQAPDRPGVTTLALVDLDKLHALSDEVKPLLTPEALRAAARVPGTHHDFRDLGSVLDELEKRAQPDARPALAHARESLRATVLASKGDLSQLSVQGPDEP